MRKFTRGHFIKQGFLVATAASLSVPVGSLKAASPLQQPRQRWEKLKQIFAAVENDKWDQNPSSPHVIECNGKLRMYYEGRQAHIMPDGRRVSLLRIGMAEAAADDPLTWIKYEGNPTFGLGAPGAIDSHWAGYPWIVRITDTHWHMYYAAWDGQLLPGPRPIAKWCTTMAESDDAGLTWHRTGKPLLQVGRPGACDQHGTGSCSVVKVGEEYWMWYTAIFKPGEFRRISTALAVSRDGGHTFEPHPAGAVLSLPPLLGSPGSTSSKPHVELRDGKFRMWYSCAKDGTYYRIHYAESEDGVLFRWIPDPVLDVSPKGWDSEMTCYPSVVHLPGRTLMFYAGNKYGGIGVAQANDLA